MEILNTITAIVAAILISGGIIGLFYIVAKSLKHIIGKWIK